MLVVLSPAKKLNMSSSIDAIPTTPKFSKNASELASIANTLKLTELQNLMGISENLAKLNADRFASFGNQETRPAALAFAGDTYVGLNANSFKKNEMELKNLKSTNISCNSKILFKNRDNKIFAPTTKFNNLLSVEL